MSAIIRACAQPQRSKGDDVNCCEHGDHEAPAGKRFCCRHCAECELADFDAESFDCAGICSRRFNPGQPGFGGCPDPSAAKETT